MMPPTSGQRNGKIHIGHIVKQTNRRIRAISKNGRKKSGDLHIDEVNNIWTYGINIDGTRYEVSYINGEADFTPYMKAYVEGPEFTGDRRADRKIAEQLLWENEGITPPEGCECHHTLDGKQIQRIPKEVHKMFTHRGGAVSEMKHRMSQLVKNERK